MALKPFYEKKFIKDVKLAKKRGKDMEKLKHIMNMLIEEKKLPPRNFNHKLQGEFKNCLECHIEPDWLLIYQKDSSFIIFIRTGTHSDLFE